MNNFETPEEILHDVVFESYSDDDEINQTHALRMCYEQYGIDFLKIEWTTEV